MTEVKDLKSLDITIIDEDLSPLISTLTGWDVVLVAKAPGLHTYTGTHEIAVCTEGAILSEIENSISRIIDLATYRYNISENSFNRDVMRDELYNRLISSNHIVELNDGKMFISCE